MRMLRYSRWLLLGAALTLVASLRAAPHATLDVPGLDISPNGNFIFHGVHFGIAHFDPQWRTADQFKLRPADGFPKTTADSYEIEGPILADSGPEPFKLEEKIKKLDPDSLHVAYSAQHATGLPTKSIALNVTIPLATGVGRAILVDGARLELPAAFKDQALFSNSKVRKVSLPAAEGELVITADWEGEMNLLIQDNRKFEADDYSVRLQLGPIANDTLTQAGLSANVKFVPYASTPFSIKSQANRGFKDEVADDKKGGWTDQGPANDLSSIKPGKLLAAGVTFDLLDPAGNGGKSALIFGKANQSELLKTATIPVPDKPSVGYVYLLHAAAWAPPGGTDLGTLTVTYDDKSHSDFPVQVGREVGDWWMAASLPNGKVGWRGENSNGPIGLYVSRFKVERKPITEIRLDASGKGMWMVAGLSSSLEEIRSQAPVPTITAATKEWVPREHKIDIIPGSIFDLSRLNDAPAGKHGQMVATPAGHFEFKDLPGQRQKFWGVNLVFSACYLEKKEADDLADRLARSGYNTVRFHHFDLLLVKKGGAPGDFDPAQMDKLDYLFAALKKRGIYMNIDLYTLRDFSDAEVESWGYLKPGEKIEDKMSWFKAMIPISDKAFENWAAYAKALLTHKNPYTELTWGDDPALIGICPVNENTVSMLGNKGQMHRAYEEYYTTHGKGVTTQASFSDTQKFNICMLEAQAASDRKHLEFLRALKVKALVSGVNFGSSMAQTELRERYDYVDDHAYMDHPSFPEKKWNLPYLFRQSDPVKDRAQVPRGMMTSRIFGKPFTCTEFNFVQPNSWRASGAVLMPAYAGLQDWDAIYNFEYSTSRDTATTPSAAGGFSIATDPINQLADRAGALLFRRGDVAAAEHAAVFAVNRFIAVDGERGHWSSFPTDFSYLGLLTRIGSTTLGGGPNAFVPGEPLSMVSQMMTKPFPPNPEGTKWLQDNHIVAVVSSEGPDTGNGVYKASANMVERVVSERIKGQAAVDSAAKRYVSETGQVELLGAVGAMKLVTPKAEAFVLPPNYEMKGEHVSVKNGETWGVVMVISADDKPLAESNRLLLLHLTNSHNTGMRFGDEDLHLLRERGKLPHLIQQGEIKVALTLPGAGWTGRGIDSSGAPVADASLDGLSLAPGVWNLVTGKGSKSQAMAYELIKQSAGEKPTSPPAK